MGQRTRSARKRIRKEGSTGGGNDLISTSIIISIIPIIQTKGNNWSAIWISSYWGPCWCTNTGCLDCVKGVISLSLRSLIYFSPFWQETVQMCHSVGLQFPGLSLWRRTETLGQSYSLSCAHRERCARGSAINNSHASPQTLGWFTQSCAGLNISSTFWSNWIVSCTKFIKECKTFTCSCWMKVKTRHINIQRGKTSCF